ncbi:hypothetical protein CesoFtcFv8_015658 [Champsocephalus esox]|uniref:Peroxisomal biogenesis factor 5-like b n=1 Tax=Champsocephalus esox TaxID=159716 RepID=A0AAN8BQK8_9TELE|nr:hypothetical protein CesoFtcFv8_015658 [Champsocephalus esox]
MTSCRRPGATPPPTAPPPPTQQSCPQLWTWWTSVSRGGPVVVRPPRRSPLRRKAVSRSPRRRADPEETELIQVEPRTPERVALDPVSPPVNGWDEVNLDGDNGGSRNRCTSVHSSRELLWSAEFKTDPLTKNCFDVHSLDGLDFSATQDCAGSRQHRRTRSLMTGDESLEDEFVRAKAAVESDTEFWDKMQAEWEELARRNWLEESEGPPPPTAPPVERQVYVFQANNPYRETPSAFTEGQDKARGGELNAAVLLLEAAIQQDPQDSEAWQVLGMTQAENENEQAAIASLQRCLELRPNNLPALMSLAVSFTNLGVACDTLQRWLSHHPRYHQLLQRGGGTPRRGPPPTRQEVLLLFQEASLMNPDSVDPDLQTGLGVLYNLSSDFQRAELAFRAALSSRPQDYLLWNRLGATLANGDRSEEAVEAYSRALELQPGFIRSRYNLGISCINLGAHREAVSNFLLALSQQRADQRCSQQQMSANIWDALRIAVTTMDRPDLSEAAEARDLDLLMGAFQLV